MFASVSGNACLAVKKGSFLIGAALWFLQLRLICWKGMNSRAAPDDPLDAASFNIEKIQNNVRSMKVIGGERHWGVVCLSCFVCRFDVDLSCLMCCCCCCCCRNLQLKLEGAMTHQNCAIDCRKDVVLQMVCARTRPTCCGYCRAGGVEVFLCLTFVFSFLGSSGS